MFLWSNCTCVHLLYFWVPSIISNFRTASAITSSSAHKHAEARPERIRRGPRRWSQEMCPIIVVCFRSLASRTDAERSFGWHQEACITFWEGSAKTHVDSASSLGMIIWLRTVKITCRHFIWSHYFYWALCLIDHRNCFLCKTNQRATIIMDRHQFCFHKISTSHGQLAGEACHQSCASSVGN